MYILLSIAMLVVLGVCFKIANVSSFEEAGRIRAVLSEPELGTKITSVSMLKSFGGKNADWEMKGFPYDGIVMEIGRNIDSTYSMAVSVPNELFRIYLLHENPNPYADIEPLKENECVRLKENDLIEIYPVESDDAPWRFKFQSGK